jgi:hypothetical protein
MNHSMERSRSITEIPEITSPVANFTQVGDIFRCKNRLLPQELRLPGIRTVEQANDFLWEEYVAEFNQRFPGLGGAAGQQVRALLEKRDRLGVLTATATSGQPG